MNVPRGGLTLDEVRRKGTIQMETPIDVSASGNVLSGRPGECCALFDGDFHYLGTDGAVRRTTGSAGYREDGGTVVAEPSSGRWFIGMASNEVEPNRGLFVIEGAEGSRAPPWVVRKVA